MKKEIDKNLHSRDLFTFGSDTMKAISNLKILIIGMRGLGIEVSKNIILLGPNLVEIYDPTIVTIEDLGSNYYLSLEDINFKRRDEAVLQKLSILNTDVNISICGKNYLQNLIKFNLIIITEMTESEKIKQIEEICISNKIAFIYGLSLGIMNIIFSDFGKNHTIYDKDGEEKKLFIINDIISDEKNGYILYNEEKGMSIKIGESFELNGIIGMEQLNGTRILITKENINYKFHKIFIGNTAKLGKYIKGGVLKQIKIPINKTYKSFEENFLEPNDNLSVIDGAKKKRKQILHSIFIKLQLFFDKNKRLPKLNNENEAKLITEEVKLFYEEQKANKKKFYSDGEDFNEKLVNNIIKFSKASLPPQCSFLGGILAHEIIKVTGKYTPIDQWFWVDFSETVPPFNSEEVDRSPLNSRYDEQIAVYGRKIIEKLSELNVFIVGAGALGCEFLKIFSLMGISTKKNYLTTVTDNDNIELSNLSRQFLFKNKDIHKSKSIIACNEVKNFNRDFNCKAHTNIVSKDTENIYDENFWKKQDLVVMAVDNVKARRYIDCKCVLNKINILECGTLGVKASSQLIIPNLTACYKDCASFSTEEEEETTVSCTIKSFPYLDIHCIQWGKYKFFEYFYNDINNCKKVYKNDDSFIEQKEDDNQNKLKDDLDNKKEKLLILKNLLLAKAKNSLDFVLQNAFIIFDINYIKNINTLLYLNNKENGASIWSSTHKEPHILKFDINNEIILDFVYSYTKIISKCLKITFNDKEYIINYFQNNSENLSSFCECGDIKDDIEKLFSYVKSNIKIENIDEVKGENFEKDDDQNFHINFINSCSNLRALNYNIEKFDFDRTKLIAGKILPAINTTTSSITGFISSQIYSMFFNKIRKKFKQMTEMNLGLSKFNICYPPEIVRTNKPNEEDGKCYLMKSYDNYCTIKFNSRMTFGDFCKLWQEELGITIENLYNLYDNKPIIVCTSEEEEEKIKSSYIEDLYYSTVSKGNKDKSSRIFFNISGFITKGDEEKYVKMPTIEYIYATNRFNKLKK